MKVEHKSVQPTLIASDKLFNVSRIRDDFPILKLKIHGKPLVYLDNAATTQKPQSVIDSIEGYYLSENSNIHRGIHLLSENATKAYEDVRTKVQRFINASNTNEIVFVSGTTEGINLVAQSYGRTFLKEDDEIIITTMEHHSNIVPWQLVCEQVGAKLRVVPINQDGELLIDEFKSLLNSNTKFIALAHVSNVLGTLNPVREIIEAAHARNIPVLLDGAQAASHIKIDVQNLDCDFYVFSGHKLYGPTGIGILYAKANFLEAMPPYKGGGDMISVVTFEKTQYNILPFKFEAGTPNIAGVIGLGSAIDYVNKVGLDTISAYEQKLLNYATKSISSVQGLRILGTAKEKTSVLSFDLEGIHAHDIGTILDREGVAVRAGHHCAMPLMERFGLSATVRASLAFYNTKEEIDILVQGILTSKEIFA